MINKKAFLGQQELGNVLYRAFSTTSGPLSKMMRSGAEKLVLKPSMGVGEALKGGIQYLASHKSPGHLIDYANLAAAPARAAEKFGKPVVGMIPEHPQYKGVQKVTGALMHGIGNQAANLDAILYGGQGMKGSNIFTRLPEYFKRDIKGNMYYVGKKSVGGQNPVHERSLLGKAFFPLVGSGVGMGALGMAMHRKEDGKPATLAERVPTGISETLKWGIATPAMTGKLFAYDLPKAGFNILKRNKNSNKE